MDRSQTQLLRRVAGRLNALGTFIRVGGAVRRKEVASVLLREAELIEQLTRATDRAGPDLGDPGVDPEATTLADRPCPEDPTLNDCGGGTLLDGELSGEFSLA